MASTSCLAVNAAVCLGSRPVRTQRALRARHVAQPTARRTNVVRAAASDGESADGYDSSSDHNHNRRRRRQDDNNKSGHHHRPFSKAPTPRTPGDLHRRAAAAAARAMDDAAKDANEQDPGASAFSSSSSSSSSAAAASAAAAASNAGSSSSSSPPELPYPYPSNDAANAVSPMARGVCWSNLIDLDTIPDEKSVYILVFGAGTGSEGLYSLQERTKEDVPVDIILAFPSHEDAARYGTLLEAEMGRVPVVEAARPRDLRFTCREGGYRCKVARRGALLMPPEKTVEVTDWERTNALRKGQWSVQLDDSNASAAHNLGLQDAAAAAAAAASERPGGRQQAVGLAGGSAEGVAMDGDEEDCDEDDEACELPEDYDEMSARKMLSRMFNRGDWGPSSGEEEE